MYGLFFRKKYKLKIAKNCILAEKHQMVSENELKQIYTPITFNPYKHHLDFLKEKILTWQNQSWAEVEKEMVLIGTNLIDLYCGKLSVDEIGQQCLHFAEKEDLTSAEKLKNWLFPKEFRKIKFSDNSEWVVKQGLDSTRFLHVHPAKHSPLTVRVRGTTLKTVVALRVLTGEKRENRLELQRVNRVRTEKLGLSPVKTLEKGKGIARIWALFS
jgi:hypothetical protein